VREPGHAARDLLEVKARATKAIKPSPRIRPPAALSLSLSRARARPRGRCPRLSAAERAPVGKVLRPAPARELVQPRNVGHRLGPEAEPARGGQDEAVARAAPRDERGGLGAARRRDGRAVAVPGQVGGQRVPVGAVVGAREAVDGPLDVVDEGGAVALADLHREADAVGSSAWKVFFFFFARGVTELR